MVCPFGAVRPGEVFTIKCDMCADREAGPVCVEACPTGALFEATADEFAQRRKAREAAKQAELKT
jgi:Fe-S-cluster-containing hydrogenase component 2